jgi:DNA topoisomerase-1
LLERSNNVETVVDPEDAAESAGLIYVSDERPGIRRRRSGKGFAYFGTDGRRLTDAREEPYQVGIVDLIRHLEE